MSVTSRWRGTATRGGKWSRKSDREGFMKQTDKRKRERGKIDPRYTRRCEKSAIASLSEVTTKH